MMHVTLYIYHTMKRLVSTRFTVVTNTVLLASVVNMRRKSGRNTEQKAFRNMFIASFANLFSKTKLYTQWEWADIPRINAHVSWIKIDQLDVTCFIISLFTAQHVSNVSTSIFRSLRLIVDLFHVLYSSGSMCVGVTMWFGWGGVVSLCRLKPEINPQ